MNESGSTETDPKLEQAMENSEPLIQLGRQLADNAIAHAARESGRTPDEQLKQMGGHYAYLAAEQNPTQRQLDEYTGQEKP